MAKKAPKKAKKVTNGGHVPRTKKTAPGSAALKGLGPVERTEDQVRELFLKHRNPWNAAQASLKSAKKRLADVVAALKNDGFKKKQMEIADMFGEVKGEARVTAEVADRLQVARWLGHPMGAQLDLFAQPDRTPITESAYDAGKMASMQNEGRKPPHAPETEAYRSWMSGYEDHQRELAGKFKSTGQHAAPTAAH